MFDSFSEMDKQTWDTAYKVRILSDREGKGKAGEDYVALTVDFENGKAEMAEVEASRAPFKCNDPKFLGWKRRRDAGEAYIKDMDRLIGFLKLTAEEFERTGVVFDVLWVLHERCKGRHDATDVGAAAEERSEGEKEWQKLLAIRKRYDFLEGQTNELSAVIKTKHGEVGAWGP